MKYIESTGKGRLPRMTIQLLYYFEKAAELSSYTKAAESLYVSQPALSYAIGELEKELKVPLFQKQGRRQISLTKYGELYLAHVKKALRELELGKQDIDSLINPDFGHITISHVSATNVTFVPYIIKEFYKNPRNKNIEFTFVEHPTKSVSENIKNGKSDIGFSSKLTDPKIECYPVYSEELILIVNKGHPLASLDEVDLKIIEEYSVIAYNKQCGIRKEIDEMFDKVGVTQNIICEVVDNVLIASLVSAGLGVAVVPQMYGDDYYDVRPLRIMLNGTRPKRRLLYMVWSEEHFQSPALQRFIEFVKTISRRDGDIV